MNQEEEWIDLRPFVREYVSALGRVHLKVRGLIAPKIAHFDAVISDAIARFRALPDAGEPLGLAAMEVNESELLEGRRPTFVSTKPVERRKQLEQRNRKPIHFHTKVITSEVDPPKG